MEQKILEILVCPVCKGKLVYDRSNQELICEFDHLTYFIRNGVPIMKPENA